MSARDRLRHLSVDWLRPLIVVVILLALGAQWWEAERDRDYFAGQLGDAQEVQDELAEGLATVAGQVEGLGGTPAVEVEQTPDGPEPVDAGETSQQGEQGERGRDAPPPSQEQVDLALARYCDEHGCSEPPSALDAANAIATYCNARGECSGVPGRDGTDGQDGADADPVTDAQIAAGVDNYCAAHDGCRGPQGEPGQVGADGQDGADGAPGPACPEGAAPITWPVDEARSAVIGLPVGTYVLCRAA